MPDDPEVLDTLGYVQLRQGYADLAGPKFRAAIRAAETAGAPPRAIYHYHLGLALRLSLRNRSAAKAFEQVLALDPDFPEAERARRERAAALKGEPPSADLF